MRATTKRTILLLAHRAGAMAALIVGITAGATPATAGEPPRGAPAARAEIQIGLCAPPDRIERALDLIPRGAPIEVWLFDDTALTLFGRGLRLRLRVAKGGSEFTLKVADQDCAQLDPKAVPRGEGKCEYDVHGASMAGAVTLTRALDARETSDLIAGRVAPAQMLSAAQTRYLRNVVGLWPLPPALRGLGPIALRTYATRAGSYDVDVSQLPAGEQYVEISRKVKVADATRAMGVLEADLARAGVEACADQSAQAVNKLRSLLR